MVIYLLFPLVTGLLVQSIRFLGWATLSIVDWALLFYGPPFLFSFEKWDLFLLVLLPYKHASNRRKVQENINFDLYFFIIIDLNVKLIKELKRSSHILIDASVWKMLTKSIVTHHVHYRVVGNIWLLYDFNKTK